MPSMTEIICKCGCSRKKMVRTADVKRGWGKFFSKRCKAVYQSRSGGSDKYYNARHRRRAAYTADQDGGVGLSLEDMSMDNAGPFGDHD